MLYVSDKNEKENTPLRFTKRLFISLISFAILLTVDFKPVAVSMRLRLVEWLMLTRTHRYNGAYHPTSVKIILREWVIICRADFNATAAYSSERSYSY